MKRIIIVDASGSLAGKPLRAIIEDIKANEAPDTLVVISSGHSYVDRVVKKVIVATIDDMEIEKLPIGPDIICDDVIAYAPKGTRPIIYTDLDSAQTGELEKHLAKRKHEIIHVHRNGQSPKSIEHNYAGHISRVVTF